MFSLLILVIFYGIYFGKMYAQKQQGIQTRQIGKRKEKNIRIIEKLMAIATFVIVPVQIISIILDYHMFNYTLRIIGIIIGLIGDILFLIAVLTMKDSWRAGIPDKDKTEMITTGIYSISRNPAFVGFDLMYMGICLAYCNIMTIIFTLFAIIMLHFQILQEEKFLTETFKDEYVIYKSKVCRYLGRK